MRGIRRNRVPTVRFRPHRAGLFVALNRQRHAGVLRRPKAEAHAAALHLSAESHPVMDSPAAMRGS